ncbi:hypothetical protein DHEL01_v205473 [Diaporthe helianthi]|uniref:Uncharacterized protein n=1 Tax=Diaporthe helianthi TaxID=158607 RepID=A0A2P5I0U3_DIAHE|nr:hypothetical protein DHEL01_v205473 [Diaporthe helianthi]
MQLTETVTIINKSGKIIGNGRHIVNIFKEAKAAYQDKKASIKAERAAAAELRPGLKKAQTYAGPAPSQYTYGPDQVYDAPDRRHFLEYDEGSYYTHEPERIDDGDCRRSIDDAGSDGRSVASSRRSHATSHRSHASHRSHRSKRTSRDDDETRSTRPPLTAPLTASNLRTHSEVSSTAPSQITAVYRSPYAETAPRDSMMMSRPNLARAPTAPPSTMVTMEPALVHVPRQNYAVMHHAMSESDLSTVRPTPPPKDKVKKKKEIDMNLAYGTIPPDLASRTDLGPVTRAEEERAAADAELKRQHEARALMARIDTILDEAEAVQHSASSIIDHLQRKPEAAAAVALMLAELSTLLKTLGPGFLSVVKGGSPAIFALLASPQFLVGVGVAVGVTVVCFGGWKIVKRIKEAKAVAAEREASAQAYEMHGQQQYYSPYQQQEQYVPRSGQSGFEDGGSRYGPSEDDALVLEEELSTIETWRRGIVPSELGEDEDDELARSIAESADLELITPDAAQSVRDDGRSIRTVRTHRSSKSHRTHRSSHRWADEEDAGTEVPDRRSSSGSSRASRAGATESVAAPPPSEAGSDRSQKTSRSKANTVRTSATRAIEDGSRQREENSLESVLQGSQAPTLGSRKNSMLKTLFRKKKEREDGRESAAVSVLA